MVSAGELKAIRHQEKSATTVSFTTKYTTINFL
jgi:hypothetical protein